jgi:hypothetical protein
LYVFGDDLLHDRITVHLDRDDMNLLSARTRLMVGDVTMRAAGEARVVEQTPAKLVRCQSFTGNGSTLVVTSRLESDGFYFLKVEAEGDAPVPPLTLEVPVREPAGGHCWGITSDSSRSTT